MDLEKLRLERQKWMTWKNIAPLRAIIDNLEEVEATVTFGDVVKIDVDLDDDKLLLDAKALMPWRKGPFEIGSTFIDTEWQSNIKYNLLRPHFDLKNKRVADIGCNNGYYMFKMLENEPKSIVGFDP